METPSDADDNSDYEHICQNKSKKTTKVSSYYILK